MKDDPKFNISFVQCIEKHECLYNYTLKDYSNKEEQDRAWRIVALQMESTVPACKERWKNLRASLCRHLRQQAGMPGTKSKRPYYLADYMQFVMPFTKIRPLQKGFSHLLETLKTEETEHEEFIGSEQEYNLTEDSGLLQDVEDSEMLGLTIESPSSTNNKARLEEVKCIYKHKSVDPMELCELEYCQSKKQKREASEDADLLFLKSLMPDIKKMTDKQKICFKRTVLNSINDILYENDQVHGPSQSHSPSSCA